MFMPPQPNQQQTIKFKPQDLAFFKNIILAFIIAKLVSIGANIFVSQSFGTIGQLFGTMIDIGGTAILIFGIYKMSQEYTELRSGVKVALLFGGVVGIDVLTGLFNFLYPASINTNTTSGQDNINQLKMILTYFYVIMIFSVISAVITVIAVYYFTEWFNLGFSNKMTQIKVFLYYGIIFGVGQIILAITYLIISQIISGVINTGFSTQSDINNLNSANNIGTIGVLVLLASYITEIIAGIKIYNRVNDYFTGKYFFQPYFAPYQQFYPGNPYQQQQFYQGNPNQQQQPYQGNPYQQQQPYQGNPYQQQQPYQGNPYQQPFPNNPYQQPYQGTGPQPQNNLNSAQESQELPQSKEELSSTTDIDSSSSEPPKNLICKNCSIPLPPQTKFCFRCGQKVE